MLDAVKDLGFKYATRFGATIGMDDIVIPEAKKALIKEANSQVDEIQRQYLQGHITNEERYNRVIEVWSSTNELITNELMDELKKDHDGFNPVYMMAHSGRARKPQPDPPARRHARPHGQALRATSSSCPSARTSRRACRSSSSSSPPTAPARVWPTRR